MNWLDIVIIISLAGGLIGGLVSGLIRSLLSLVGIVLGIFLAGRLYPAVSSHLTFVSNPSAANILAFALVFLAVVLAAAIIGFVLHRLVSAITLGCLDRLLGGLLGLLIGFVSWGALLSIWLKFLPDAAGAVTGSSLAQWLVARFPLVLTLLPGSFQGVKDFFN